MTFASTRPTTSALDAAEGLTECVMVNGVAFRRKLIAVLVDHQESSTDRDAEMGKRNNNGATTTMSSSSSLFVDAIRADPEIGHPNWTQDEMMRLKPCNQSWVDTRLPPTVWAAPPLRPSSAVPSAISGVPGIAIPGAPVLFTPPSSCPFGLQFQDVVTVQHRSH